MRKPNSTLWPIAMALVVAGCATQPPPRFGADPLAGNPPPPTLFSSQPAPSTTQPIVRPPETPPANPPAAVAPAPAPATVNRTLAPELLRPPDALYTLGPGDQLDIETLGAVPYRATAVVGLDGKIYYSYLPGLDVWGKTLVEAKARIEEELSKYITQPQVSVSLKAVGSKYIWVLGRVTKPGIYPFSGAMTLLEAISLAGGTATSATASSYTTQDLADLRHSFVMRDGKPLPIDFVRLLKGGDMSQNIYVKPDDFIYIPSSLSQQVYVLGAVAQPHAVPYSDQMTVLSAIASAGGVVKNAYQSHVGIVRGSLSQPQLIVADYHAIFAGKTQNILVEPGDIVYVPLTPYHVFSDYADWIATTFARAWSANMGVRAVEGSTQVGVSLPVGSVSSVGVSH